MQLAEAQKRAQIPNEANPKKEMIKFSDMITFKKCTELYPGGQVVGVSEAFSSHGRTSQAVPAQRLYNMLNPATRMRTYVVPAGEDSYIAAAKNHPGAIVQVVEDLYNRKFDNFNLAIKTAHGKMVYPDYKIEELLEPINL